MPKATTPDARLQRRHNPLADDIVATGPLKTSKGKKRKSGSHGVDEERDFVDTKASRKILKIGRELVDEDDAEADLKTPGVNPAFDFDSRFGADEEDEEEGGALDDGDDAWGDEEEEEIEEIDVDPNDLDAFNRFMPSASNPFDPEEDEEGQGTNLADLILQRIAEHEAIEGGEKPLMGGGAMEDAVELPAKVVEVYTK
jgi:essential nuclear protein 1